jgi:hypothetical protein
VNENRPKVLLHTRHYTYEARKRAQGDP